MKNKKDIATLEQFKNKTKIKDPAQLDLWYSFYIMTGKTLKEFFKKPEGRIKVPKGGKK